MKKIRGITLIEILITILIMGILASLAAPSFMGSFEKRRLVSAAEDLYSHLQLARSEALSGKLVATTDPTYPSNSSIYMSFSGSGTTSWAFGINEGSSCVPTVTSNTATGACVLMVDNGDGVNVLADDAVLTRVDGSLYEGVSLKISNTSSIEFDPVRGTVDGIRKFTLQSPSNDTVLLTQGVLGNVSICSDDLSEFRGCS